MSEVELDLKKKKKNDAAEAEMQHNILHNIPVWY